MEDDRDRVRAHFDAFGDAEWDRLESSPRERVSFELHRRLLAELIRAGDRVLEIGAGPCRLVAASASSCMSLGDAEVVAGIEVDPERWRWFVDWEAALCREPGALDGGTHTIFAVRRD